MDTTSLVRHIRSLTGPIWMSRLRYAYIYGVLVVLALLLVLSFGGLHSLPRIATSSGMRQTGHNQHHIDLSLPDPPFVSWPLARLCDETDWVPGVVFACSNNSGGIGNIRNFILTCLRYAIEAGATGLVLPQIQSRSETDLAHLFGGHQPFDYFFDTAHFRQHLNQACPAITVYDQAEDIPHLTDTRSEPIRPKSFGMRGGCDYRDLNRHTDAFRERFHAWLATSAVEFDLHVGSASALHPRLFQPVWGVQWEWPVAKDGPAFVNTFGGLLRFRQDILDLGMETVAAMRRRSSDAATTLQPRSRPATGQPQKFAGIHLRTENDALSFWPTFATQTTEFLESLSNKSLHSIYLATGNATEAAKFRDKALGGDDDDGGNDWKGPNLNILTKDELLQDQPKLLQHLQSMTWDQQALVDFVVLLSSDFFLGVSPSSFSMNIAARRHLTASATTDNDDDGIHTRPWKVGDQGDARSRLVGNYTGYWNDWLFMYDALWP